VLQPVAVAVGFVADSFTMYPVTATLSEAVSAVMETVREFAVEGTVKVLTVGRVVSAAVAGRLLAFPGNVPALISVMFVKVSPSESIGSIVLKAVVFLPAVLQSVPYAFNAGALVWHRVQLLKAVDELGYVFVNDVT